MKVGRAALAPPPRLTRQSVALLLAVEGVCEGARGGGRRARQRHVTPSRAGCWALVRERRRGMRPALVRRSNGRAADGRMVGGEKVAGLRLVVAPAPLLPHSPLLATHAWGRGRGPSDHAVCCAKSEGGVRAVHCQSMLPSLPPPPPPQEQQAPEASNGIVECYRSSKPCFKSSISPVGGFCCWGIVHWRTTARAQHPTDLYWDRALFPLCQLQGTGYASSVAAPRALVTRTPAGCSTAEGQRGRRALLRTTRQRAPPPPADPKRRSGQRWRTRCAQCWYAPASRPRLACRCARAVQPAEPTARRSMSSRLRAQVRPESEKGCRSCAGPGAARPEPATPGAGHSLAAAPPAARNAAATGAAATAAKARALATPPAHPTTETTTNRDSRRTPRMAPRGQLAVARAQAARLQLCLCASRNGHLSPPPITTAAPGRSHVAQAMYARGVPVFVGSAPPVAWHQLGLASWCSEPGLRSPAGTNGHPRPLCQRRGRAGGLRRQA